MNGFEIQITEKDFKAKPTGEQNWILFQGISGVYTSIGEIDENGCEFARRKQRGYRLRIAAAVGAGFAGGLGTIYTIFHLLHHGG